MSNKIIQVKDVGNVVFPLAASKSTYLEYEKRYTGEDLLRQITDNPFSTPSSKELAYQEIGRRRAWVYALVKKELPHLLDETTIES